MILKVVDKFLDELDGQLAEKRVELDVSTAAKAWFAEKGYDKAFGARPMARLIQQELKAELADALLFGELRYGGVAKVGIADDKLSISFEGRPKPEGDEAEGDGEKLVEA